MCRRRGRGQGGQAILEYLFLLFFVMILFAGFVYQFNGALKKYFDDYFRQGGYLSCLIENGILPGEQMDDGTSCDAPTFDLNNGKTKKLPGFVANPTKDPGSLSHGGSTYANNNSSGRAYEGSDGRLVPIGGGASGAKKIDKGGKVTKISGKNGSGDGNAGFETYNGPSVDSASEDAKRNGGTVPIASGKSESGGAKKATTLPASDRDLKTAREIAMEKAARKSRLAQESARFDLSFGNILKYIIIILLLFGIIFFVGSQLVAVSRGKRKRT